MQLLCSNILNSTPQTYSETNAELLTKFQNRLLNRKNPPNPNILSLIVFMFSLHNFEPFLVIWITMLSVDDHVK